MTLLPLLKTILTIPEIRLQDTKIGENKLVRFALLAHPVEVAIYNSDYNGWYEIRTDKPAPYDVLFLHHSKKRIKMPKRAFCIKMVKTCEIDNIDENTRLTWLQHPTLNDTMGPDEIVKSWRGLFQFREDQPDLGLPGLRTPQLGALHAISAYFSVQNNLEPATVVLPTGTGKTETMLSVLVYRQLSKVLVLVPSNSLRDQISEKFISLGYLSQLGLIPNLTALPAVVSIKKSIKSTAEAEMLLKHGNVFVATASVLNCSHQDSIDRLCAGLSDLFVDEAHHISANTWANIRDKFIGKRVVQFTATPFRNNGNALGGRIIYNYTMGEAQKAGYFRHINLIPVEEYYIGEGDFSIARAAIKRLKTDLKDGFDHLLMARVERKPRAAELLPLYQKLAPELNPILVHSGMNKGAIKNALSALFNRESRIVICVNMLGEGFDLPSLKIAAIHDIHKSLAITLQFIGRFTRQKDSLGDASVIVNIAEPEVESGLQHLYAQGADWDNVLKRLSEGRIQREVRLQEVVEQLKEKGNLHKQLSLWNLRPSYSAMLFKTSCDTWQPELFKEIIPDRTERWYAISDDENLLIVLAIHQAPVKWGKYKNLNDSVYKLVIAHWDEDRSALFMFSNDYKWFRVEKLSQLVCDGACELLSGPKVFNVFNGLQYPLVRNLGASQIGAISFTQYFGSNVTEGLNRIESSKSNLSNLAGLGYDNGDKVIWGCSQKKGKIWSMSSGSISDWTDWVKIAWDKVMSSEPDEQNITQNFLRPKRIEQSHPEYAVAVQWGEHIQADPEDRVMVIFGKTEVPLYLVDLKIISQGPDQPYCIGIIGDDSISVYEFIIDGNLNGGFDYRLQKGEPVSIKRLNRNPKPIEEYLQIDPWIIQYVDGSYSYNCFFIKLPDTIGEFTADHIDCWDWGGIDIKKESMGKTREENTVQWRTFEKISNLYDVIINDDGTGEAADLVGLKIVKDEIFLGLVHCKYSKEENPGARIGDLYEVCGQAQKSIRWKHAGIKRLYSHIKNREELWKAKNSSRFLKGSMSDLANIKRRSRTAPVKLSIFIVQPGLRKNDISADMLRLIGSTEVYLKNTAQAELLVVGS